VSPHPAWRSLVLSLLLGGCSLLPPSEEPPPPVEPDFTPAPSTPLIESPPLEPVPPPAAATPAPAPAPATPAAPSSGPAPARPVTPPTPPATTPVAPPTAVPPTPPLPQVVEPPEDAQLNALLAELARFTSLPADDLRRELANAAQALTRQRSDANRVRLGVLYTMARNVQDDQRAVQLFDNVAHSGGPVNGVKALAAVLQAQVSERVRAVREEQQKGEAAVRKLDQLLEMERTLLRDRVRSGGGGGGGGAGGSAGGR